MAPPDVALELARQRAHHEHGRLALAQVLTACRAASIDVRPVKGIVTASLFYEDSGQRPIQDLDLRVSPRDLDRVESAALRAGWRMVSHSRAYETVAYDVLGVLVEFESHVGPPGLCGLLVDDMLRRASPCCDPIGIPHLRPEIHDHALLRCVNAFKEKLIDAQRGAIRDLELLPMQPGFNPGRLIALAGESGSTNIVWIVATWLADERASPAWREIRALLGDRPGPRPVYAWLFTHAIRESRPPRQALRVLARVGADRPDQWVRAIVAMARQPLSAAAAECRVRSTQRS